MWDVMIAGAGVVGCAAARELSKYELKVLVLERGHDVCSGTSKGNSAMVHAGFDPEPGTNKAVYNVRGNAMYDALCRELDVPFTRNGLITCAYDEEQTAILRQLKDYADQNGVEAQILSPEALREIEPDCPDDLVAGLWAPTSGVVCPYTLVIALAENASLNGVSFRMNAEVTDIRKTAEGFDVFAGGERYRTKVFINAAGTHADLLNNMVSSNRIRIIPRQGEHLILDRKYGEYVKACIGEVPAPLPGGGHTKGVGFITSMDGTVVVGCNARDVEDRDDVRITAEGLQSIFESVERQWEHTPFSKKVPGFPVNAIISSFSGVRAHPETDDFILGEPEDAPGFLNAAGIESPGLTAGPAIGEFLRNEVLRLLSPAEKKDYKPGRPYRKPFRLMSDEERREAIALNPEYAKIVCRCEQVTEAEVRDAIRRELGARSINAVKMRTRAGMGRCQGGFCSPRVLQILAEELQVSPLQVTLSGGNSPVLLRRTGEGFGKEAACSERG